MARIRSIHPGIFTDETFACLSSDAQILLLGLGTEADDRGIFEWKPITLRMRLRPTKDGDVAHILAELVGSDRIKKYEIAGREYGAIRNFGKWQRPKSPKYVHPITPEIGNYVASTAAGSEPDAVDDTSFPPNGETRPQREEVGGMREDGNNKRAREPFEKFWTAFQPPPDANKPEALKAWEEMAPIRPILSVLLAAVEGYNSWLAERSRKERREYPKQHPKTWLRGEVWNGFLPASSEPETPTNAARRDAIDKMLSRGKYAPVYQ